MFTKIKVVLITAACLVGGVAGIAAADGGGRTFDRAAKKAEMLAKYDINKDGKLDKTERAVMKNERAEIAFKKADANNDGQLSLDEFKQLRQHHGQGRGGHRHHRGAGKRGGFTPGSSDGGQP